LLCVNLKGKGGAWFHTNREIPVWDATEVLTRGNPAVGGGPPTLYRGFADALNAAGDSHPLKAAGRKKLAPSEDDLVRPVFLDLSADRQRPAMPDALWHDIDKRHTVLYGTLLLAGNAVIATMHGTGSRVADLGNGRMPNYGDWRVIAIDRTDRTTVYEVMLPDAPAPSGMSLTRAGDTIVPLVDGRVVCIGGGTAPRPLPASKEQATVPGLRCDHYATDVPIAKYHSWSAEDLAIVTPTRTAAAANLNPADENADHQGVRFLRGFLEAPETGRYRFYGRSGKGGLVRFTLLDQTGHFVENTFDASEYGGQSTELFLAKGKHPLQVTIMPGSGDQRLTIQWEWPEIKRSDIPAAALSHLPEHGP
jgi:hypothetical protein